MTLLALLMQMGYRGNVTTNDPDVPLSTNENIKKKLEGIPVMLFSGSDNQVLNPTSTEKTYEVLRDIFGNVAGVGEEENEMGEGGWNGYSRNVIQGYGHLDCWMGREAYRDVYPVVRREVDRVCRRKEYKHKEINWRRSWGGWKGLEKSGGDLPSRTELCRREKEKKVTNGI